MQTGPLTRKVLIADDQEAFRNRLRPFLEQAGYEVAVAADGVEALGQVEAQRPDLILLDALMPRMDGFDALARLKSDPHTASIPIVMLLGMPSEAREYPAVSRPGEVVLSEHLALVVIKPLLKDPADLIRAMAEL